MSSHEFSEWQVYASSEPFGEVRDDYRAALIACVIANANRDPEKQSEPFEVKDFLLNFGEDDDRNDSKQTPEDIWYMLKTWAIAAKG